MQENSTFQKKDRKCSRYSYHLRGTTLPSSSRPASSTIALKRPQFRVYFQTTIFMNAAKFRIQIAFSSEDIGFRALWLRLFLFCTSVKQPPQKQNKHDALFELSSPSTIFVLLIRHDFCDALGEIICKRLLRVYRRTPRSTHTHTSVLGLRQRSWFWRHRIKVGQA